MRKRAEVCRTEQWWLSASRRGCRRRSRNPREAIPNKLRWTAVWQKQAQGSLCERSPTSTMFLSTGRSCSRVWGVLRLSYRGMKTQVTDNQAAKSAAGE